MTTMYAIGECMIELSGDNPAKVGFGGDCYNVCYYYSLLGQSAEFVTVLGQDPQSDRLKAAWQKQGVGTQYISNDPYKTPGLYWIHTDDQGERSFSFWRGDSAAKKLMHYLPSLDIKLSGDDAIYCSMISLAILSEQDKESFLNWVMQQKENGATIIFDSNYRPTLWNGIGHAQTWARKMLPLTDIYLPGKEEFDLYHEQSIESFINDNQQLSLLVIKQGEEPTLCFEKKNNFLEQKFSVSPVSALDTTSAGDSFNAGFLAMWLQGKTLVESVNKGQAVSAQVVQHTGALIDAKIIESMVE